MQKNFYLISVVFATLLLLAGTGGAPAPTTVKAIQLELPTIPKPAEQTALAELQHYLALVVADTLTVNQVPIARIKLATMPEMAEEAWHIRSEGDTLTITGGGSRGVLYGVYNFLENQLGVHWWTPTEESIPAARNIELPRLDLSGRPGMLYRDIWRTDEHPDAGRFCARNRINRDGDADIPAAVGGSFAYGSPYHCHTFDLYFPKAQYFETHPEYYSLRDGERRAGQYQGQICLTNPEVRTLTLEKLRAYIEADRKRAAANGAPAPRLYDISMNDNWNACRCPACAEAAGVYGDSGVLLRFLNAIAEEILPDYPDIYLTTLGYFYHEPAPTGGVVAHHRVIVKLCDTTSSQAVGILHPVNTAFKQLVESWKGATDNLFIWDYGINYLYPALPYPGEMTFGELHRFLRDNQVKGIFWQHDEAAVAEFYPMKVWLEAKLMENPDADFAALCRTFLDGYFGAAGTEVGHYRELLADAANRNSARVDCMAGTAAYQYVDVDTLLACHQAMDRAEAAVATDPVLTARVIRARAGLDALTGQWMRVYQEAWLAKHGTALPLDRKQIAARLRAWGRDNAAYTNPERLLQVAEQYADYAESMPESYTPPSRFAGRKYRDFTAETLSVTADPGIRLERDDAAENGVALQLDLNQDVDGFFRLPFEFGIYDPSVGRHIEKFVWDEAPEKRDYQWYPIGGANQLNKSSFVYLSRSWRVQARLVELGDATPVLEGWVRMRFAGPAFYPDEGGASYIRIDRVVLVEP